MNKQYEKIIQEYRKGFGSKLFYKLVSEKYNDYYQIDSIIEFPECNITYTQLIKRIQKIKNKEGQYYTLWDAISIDVKERQIQGYYKDLLDRNTTEILIELHKKNFFTNFLRTKPIGLYLYKGK